MHKSSLGDRLISFRNSKNITQKMVADELGVSINTVSRWEVRKFKSIKLDDLMLLLDFYCKHGYDSEIIFTPKTKK